MNKTIGNGNSIIMLVINAITVAVLIFIDQFTKILLTPLKENGPIILINGVLELRYLENRGAAFGMLQGARTIFLVIAVFVVIVMGYIFIKIPNEKKYIKLNIVLSFILAGAIGNTIDRVILGYVRDFIYFSLINFPVFNVADMYITCTVILLILLIIFAYKDEDFDFLKGNKEK